MVRDAPAHTPYSHAPVSHDAKPTLQQHIANEERLFHGSIGRQSQYTRAVVKAPPPGEHSPTAMGEWLTSYGETWYMWPSLPGGSHACPRYQQKRSLAPRRLQTRHHMIWQPSMKRAAPRHIPRIMPCAHGPGEEAMCSPSTLFSCGSAAATAVV